GTPSTEILENLIKYPDVYCQWSPNEKVALEFSAGASLAGARSIVCMKHVGLNVAADPLMTLAYVGIKGGMAIIVADDPGMHSSQNEQDSRHYARCAKVPLLEPSDSQEAKDFVPFAMNLSEQFRTPVIIRSTTRISHSKSVVSLGERTPHTADGYEHNPSRYVTVPAYARQMRVALEKRFEEIRVHASETPINQIIEKSGDLGIITSGISYQYAAEIFPEASFLKLGMVYPFPDDLIRRFAGKVKRILVVEELDNFLEEHVRSLGIAAMGREYIPGIGELNLDILSAAQSKINGAPKPVDTLPRKEIKIPPRPPAFCPGCPHRSVFYELSKLKPVIIGDIGCYSLAVSPPLNAMDLILCMGAGISSAHGASKARTGQKVVGVVGDSTFFHSGITGLLDIGYNKGDLTIFVLDNRITAMTGRQDHPGTGVTLMGERTREASIEEFAKACGIPRVTIVNPYDVKTLRKVIREEIEAPEASVIITKAPCILLEHARDNMTPMKVIEEKCRSCGVCLKLSCPGLEKKPGAGDSFSVVINPVLCAGCGICAQICPFHAIEEDLSMKGNKK
ncbi:indolepyruvate ferredoxin oxidoreductase subunit alpha, partial [Candidatus Sumerlaeota bacterium]|nr:indolepyruvate ferredoxin oxidoreductase subunit alpha [Candidatus Sumerlaeota bacterium]